MTNVGIISNFNPRPPCGGRRISPSGHSSWAAFQSTAPVWGPTTRQRTSHDISVISIHGPRVGADRAEQASRAGPEYFNPRPPCGGRLFLICLHLRQQYFNPRPPCGGRPSSWSLSPSSSGFQSTAPVWGPTGQVGDLLPPGAHFNPRPPCGGRQRSVILSSLVSSISIHGPRVGADVLHLDQREAADAISIHGPRVGADNDRMPGGIWADISIHGPRVGADFVEVHRIPMSSGISIHGPRVGAD